MGQVAAKAIFKDMKDTIAEKGRAVMLFASAPSQHSTWRHLIELWKAMPTEEQRRLAKGIIAFHMDEYIGLPKDSPQLFGKVLRERLFTKLGIPSENILYFNDRLGFETAQKLRQSISEGDRRREGDLAIELEAKLRLHIEGLMNEFSRCGGVFDIVVGGIGKLPHLAFNDPPKAKFNDPQTIKIVRLTDISRQQQVDDGEFANIQDVPTHAVTFSLSPILGGRHIHIMVPQAFKAEDVRQTLDESVGENIPASGLRLPNVLSHVRIYLTKEAAALSSVARFAAASKNIILPAAQGGAKQPKSGGLGEDLIRQYAQAGNIDALVADVVKCPEALRSGKMDMIYVALYQLNPQMVGEFNKALAAAQSETLQPVAQAALARRSSTKSTRISEGGAEMLARVYFYKETWEKGEYIGEVRIPNITAPIEIYAPDRAHFAEALQTAINTAWPEGNFTAHMQGQINSKFGCSIMMSRTLLTGESIWLPVGMGNTCSVFENELENLLNYELSHSITSAWPQAAPERRLERQPVRRSPEGESGANRKPENIPPEEIGNIGEYAGEAAVEQAKSHPTAVGSAIDSEIPESREGLEAVRSIEPIGEPQREIEEFEEEPGAFPMPANPEDIAALGKKISDESEGQYKFVLPLEFFGGKSQLIADRAGLDSRFHLEAVSGFGNDPAKYITNLLEKIKPGEEELTIAVIPAGLNQDLVAKLKERAGLRVVTMSQTAAYEIGRMNAIKRHMFRMNIYGTMYTMRYIRDVDDASVLYKVLSYFINGHLDLPEGMAVRAYIEALVKNDIETMIRVCLKPATPVNVKREHDNLTYPLIFA